MVIFGFVGCASIPTGLKDPPLPNDIKISPPSPDLPKETAALSGKWAGTWNNGQKAILVVEEIQENRARIVYSWGDIALFAVADHRRFPCKVISGPNPQLEWIGPEGAITNFELKDFDTLEGSRTIPGSHTSVVMKKVNE
jgi:hypothetical protein